MKYAYLISLSILINLSVTGQSIFPLKAIFFPNISQPIYKTDESVPSPVVTVIKEREIAKPSLSAGILAGIPLNNNWTIYTGINYMRTGYKYKERNLRPAVPDPIIPEKIKTVYKSENIEIPIHVNRYIFQKKKIGLYAMAGPSIWFNISNKKIDRLTYIDGRTEKEKTDDLGTEFKTVNLALSAGFGMEYKLSNKFDFFVQPMSQLSLLGMSIDAPLNRDIFNFGIAFGIILK
jgi:hypothetical protein